MGFYELAEKALALERAGRRVTRLNVGDTNLPAPPAAVEAAKRSLGKKQGYCPAAGLMEFREAIAEREGCDAGEVVVGPGSKHLIYGLISILGKGGVAFPSPYWPMYMLACAQLGLEARVVDTRMEDGWRFGPGRLSGGLSIICNPLNPTGTAYDGGAIEEAVRDARGKGGHIILDEAYKGLAFKRIPDYEGAIRVRSFSKEFSMEGFRLGYAIAPEEIARKLTAYNQITATCTAPLVQEAGMACLEDEEGILRQNRDIWKRRAQAAGEALRAAGFRFAEPDAGIYIFAAHDGIADADAFALELLDREGVCVSPGTMFGRHQGFVRICVNQPEDILTDAIRRMGGLVNLKNERE